MADYFIPIINDPASPKILEYLFPIKETQTPHMRPPIGNPTFAILANKFASSESNLRSLNTLKKIDFKSKIDKLHSRY